LAEQISGPANNKQNSFWNKDRILQLVSLVLVLVLIVVLIWQRRNIIEFSHVLSRYYGLKYLAIFVISAAASATLVIPVPGLALTSAIGAFSANPWDPVLVGLVSAVGATIGEMTGYLLGYSGRMAVPDNKNYEKIVGWMSKWGSLTIFLLALIPNPLFDLAGIAAGILKYPIWKFILVGAAGRISKHILFAYFGYWGIHFIPI